MSGHVTLVSLRFALCLGAFLWASGSGQFRRASKWLDPWSSREAPESPRGFSGLSGGPLGLRRLPSGAGKGYQMLVYLISPTEPPGAPVGRHLGSWGGFWGRPGFLGGALGVLAGCDKSVVLSVLKTTDLWRESGGLPGLIARVAIVEFACLCNYLPDALCTFCVPTSS